MRQNIVFKEWAPDAPDLGAEVLITAKNVIHSVSGYKPQKTLDSSMGTASSASIAGVIVSGGASKFDSDVYAFGGTTYFVGNSGGHFTAKGTVTSGPSIESFAQYDNLMIGVGDTHEPKAHAINGSGSFSALAASGSAPAASVIGILNSFVVIGNLGTTGATANSFPHAIQWSGIDNPTSWPTPNSATAIAQQSGYQEMDARWGQVTGIHGGDQHGVILQTGAVNRVTYIGPPAVFQFDLVSNEVGSIYRRASVQVGSMVYFLSRDGFCRTDGVSVEHIGVGKVDRFFFDNYQNQEDQIMAAHDPINHLVCWAYPTNAGGASTCDRMLSYCIDTGQWTYSDVLLESLVTPGKGIPSLSPNSALMAFNTGSQVILGKFQATAGSAVFETSDAEFNPGGRSYIDGIKMNVESSGTAPAMTTRIGYRDDLGTTPSYTSATSANSYNGFADFRVDAKYARVETTITGNFEKATGFVASFDPSSER